MMLIPHILGKDRQLWSHKLYALDSLLSNHDGKGGPSRSLDTGNDEKLLQSSQEAVGSQNLGLLIQLCANIVEIPRSLERSES